MTAQERIEQATLRKLDDIGGVWVTIQPDNITVRAQIDRINKPPTRTATEIQFQSEVGVSVYIQKRLLNSAPTENKLIVESDGTRHRIGRVVDLGQRYQCLCESPQI